MRQLKQFASIVGVFISTILLAQTNVQGEILDETGESLPEVLIQEKGTQNEVYTDEKGHFVLELQNDSNAIEIMADGFDTKTIQFKGESFLSIIMSNQQSIEEIQVVGSRNKNRTEVESAVPIDVIDISEVANKSGQVEVNQLLQYVAPSFNASKQSGSDGADHIDPATLRGLGPDQTLVLINGKRRHQSSLINVFGTRGRGNTGTDLNAIPATAIKRIEILRDGASAQYGSDAIAGVINIVLKEDVDEFSGSVKYGFYNADAQGSFTNPTSGTDGGTLKIGANYGTSIGEKGGFVNFTTEFLSKDHTVRPGASFREKYGEAAVDSYSLFVNSEIPINKKATFYAFGGYTYRDTDAYAFTRSADSERNVTAIYPNGFNPRITSIITDKSVSAGVRFDFNEWAVDVNNTYGINKFHYNIKGTLNASLEEASPTEFDAGGHTLSQNTTGIDFTKGFDVLEGLNVAFGTEYRIDNFTIFAGEEGSYATYDINGNVVDQNTPEANYVYAPNGELRPGGSQGFPGYNESNTVDKSRSNIALYVDTELDVTDKWLVSGAARFENYSDFGSTFNFKVASRYKIMKDLNLRGSVSTGFRAPSLAQIYYNLRFTTFENGVASEIMLSPNNSPITRSFGIKPLDEEKAFNTSLGFSYKKGGFTATVDGYYVKVKDRIVLTGNFDASDLNIGVNSAQFFTNGLDTKTTGLDIILNYKKRLREHRFDISLAGNINNMKIDNINNGNLDQSSFFGPRDEGFLLASAPDSKFTLGLSYAYKKFDANLTLTRFSEVDLIDYEIFEFENQYDLANQGRATDHYNAKVVTDVNVGYKFSKGMKLTLGSNNIFNQYPTQQNSDWTDSGGYWDSVQMATNGAFYYANLGFKF